MRVKHRFLLSIVIFLLAFIKIGYAQNISVDKGNIRVPDITGPGGSHINREEPEYVEGEVIVGFKEGNIPREVLRESGVSYIKIERVHHIDTAVEKYKKEHGIEKNAQGEFWFLGNKYKEEDNILDEAIFQEAYKKMSDIEKQLYRSYVVKLSEGVSVEEAISKIEANENVEYAEPNYINYAY